MAKPRKQKEQLEKPKTNEEKIYSLEIQLKSSQDRITVLEAKLRRVLLLLKRLGYVSGTSTSGASSSKGASKGASKSAAKSAASKRAASKGGSKGRYGSPRGGYKGDPPGFSY